MADRIAVFSAGGTLEQFAEPALILGDPASGFVREFAGEDRGIRRLVVTPIREEMLTASVGGRHPRIELGRSLHEALALMLTRSAGTLTVTRQGVPVGTLSHEAIFSYHAL